MPETTSPLRDFFLHPAIQMIGVIASIVSVILAIFFYQDSIKKRELTYCIHPIKSTIVSSQKYPDISVYWNDTLIINDISKIEIAFWNAGKETIQSKDVLQLFNIQFENNTPILNAKILKQSREVINLLLDSSQALNGQLGISWSILEHNDGGIVEIIFAGPIETRISASAVITEQARVHYYDLKVKPRSNEEMLKESLNVGKKNKVIAVFIVSLTLLYNLVRFPRYFKIFLKNNSGLPWIQIFLIFIVIGLIIWIIKYPLVKIPPRLQFIK